MPITAPIVQGPTAAGQIAEAAGALPGLQQQYQLNQAELDAQNFQNASQKLAVLNRIIFSSPNQSAAQNPDIVAATQRAFKQMGVAAPMQGGALDVNALQAFGPAQDFVAQNLSTLLSFTPEQRASVIQAATGQAPPQSMLDSLNKLPTRTLQNPQEAAGMLKYVGGIITNIQKGGDIGNAMTMLDAAAVPMSQLFGITPDEFKADFIANLKPDLTAQLINQAKYQLEVAQTQNNAAHAQYWQGLLSEVPAKIDEIHSSADLKRVMQEYYPEMAAAATSRAATSAAEAPSLIQERTAQAGLATARARDLAVGTQHLSALEKSANAAETSYSHIQYDLGQAQTALSTYQQGHAGADPKTDPQLRRLQADVNDLQGKATQARHTADAANNALTSYTQKMQHEAGVMATPGFSDQYGSPAATDADGNYVYRDKKGHYVYEDGTPYTPAAAGSATTPP